MIWAILSRLTRPLLNFSGKTLKDIENKTLSMSAFKSSTRGPTTLMQLTWSTLSTTTLKLKFANFLKATLMLRSFGSRTSNPNFLALLMSSSRQWGKFVKSTTFNRGIMLPNTLNLKQWWLSVSMLWVLKTTPNWFVRSFKIWLTLLLRNQDTILFDINSSSMKVTSKELNLLTPKHLLVTTLSLILQTCRNISQKTPHPLGS